MTAYVEIGPSEVEAFVRDRGPGFDLDDVPEDRLGVRQSILGRMERHGGTARVRRLDQGTEVALTLPLTPSEATPSEAGPGPGTADDLTPDTPTTEQESSHAQP